MHPHPIQKPVPTYDPHDRYVLQQLLLLAYKDLDIQVGTYLMNVANHRKFARRMELQDFFETPIRGTWNDFSHMANIATVNAYYNQATNTMVVPIGMLQPPLFWSTPKSLTFGAFGIVVGESLSLNNQRSMPNLLSKETHSKVAFYYPFSPRNNPCLRRGRHHVQLPRPLQAFV